MSRRRSVSGLSWLQGFRRRDDDTPMGINVGVGASVIVAACLLASRIPRADTGWRCGLIAAGVGGFALSAVDALAVAFLVPATWMIVNGFIENELGQLSWHGPFDVLLFATLTLAGCLGLAGGHLRRALRDLRARWQLRARIPALLPAPRAGMKNEFVEETRQRA